MTDTTSIMYKGVMSGMYMSKENADKELAELWAEVSKVFDSYLPYVDTGSESLYDKYIAFTAILDLHKRMLEMEHKLNEAGGDGK